MAQSVPVVNPLSPLYRVWDLDPIHEATAIPYAPRPWPSTLRVPNDAPRSEPDHGDGRRARTSGPPCVDPAAEPGRVPRCLHPCR